MPDKGALAKAGPQERHASCQLDFNHFEERMGLQDTTARRRPGCLFGLSSYTALRPLSHITPWSTNPKCGCSISRHKKKPLGGHPSGPGQALFDWHRPQHDQGQAWPIRASQCCGGPAPVSRL